MPDVTKIPPLVQYVIAGIVSGVSLAATQGFIENRTEKLVCGLAAIELPVTWLVIAALWNLAHARVTAARIHAGQPTEHRLTP